MKSWGYRLKFIFSNPVSIIIGTFAKATSLLGSLVTFLGVLDSVNKTQKYMEWFSQKAIWWSLGICALGSFLFSVHWIPKRSFVVNGTDSKLTIKVGDVTKFKKSIIVSTNTSFVTTMENEVISSNSVQGALQLRYYKDNMDLLDTQIANSLTEYKPKDKLTLKCNHKKYNTYDVGTVAKIRNNNRNFYFLGLNDINCDGQNEKRDINDFYVSLDKLWLFIKKKGNTEIAAIPIIGSGRAGFSIKKEEALFELVNSYIGQIQNDKILTELVVYIHPSDLQHIDVKRMLKYIENQCLFASNKNYNLGMEE